MKSNASKDTGKTLSLIERLNDIFIVNTSEQPFSERINFKALNSLFDELLDINFVSILSSHQTLQNLATENMQLLYLDKAHSSEQIRAHLDHVKFEGSAVQHNHQLDDPYSHQLISLSLTEHIIFLFREDDLNQVRNNSLLACLNIIAPLINQANSGTLNQYINARHQTNPEKLLLEIAELTTTTSDINEFYTQLHMKLQKIIYAKNLFIVLHSEDQEQIRFVYYKDELDDTPIEEMQKVPLAQMKQSLTGYVFATRTTLLATSEEIDLLAKFGSIKPQGPMTKSWIGVPLILDDRVIGVLALQSYDENIIYRSQDKFLIESIAKPIAAAIERKSKQIALEGLVERRTLQLKQINQDLTHEIAEKNKAERLQRALYDISLLASGAEDMNTFYRSIHKILGELFNTANFYIALRNLEKNCLDMVYFVDEKDQAKCFHLDLTYNTMSTVLFRLNKPVLIQREDYRDFALKYQIEQLGSSFESWLGVPLINDTESVGIMVVQSYDKSLRYEAWQRDLMQFVARQVSIALLRKQDKTNLEKEISSRTAALKIEVEKHKKSKLTQIALYKIANLANEDIKLNTFYHQLHQIITQLIYSENFYIALLNQSDTIEMVYYSDTMDDFDLSTFAKLDDNKLKQSLTGYVINKGQPLLATQKELQELAKKEKFILIGEDTVSWLGVPLFLNGKTIGVMTVQSYIADKVYTTQDRDLMIFVAQHVATAIQRKRHNTLLEIEVNQRTKELTEINSKLQVEIKQREESEQLQTALYKIAETSLLCDTQFALYSELHKIIGQLMYANSFYIAILDHSNQILNFEYFVDESGDPAPKPMPLGNTLTAYTIRQEKIIHLNREDIQKLEHDGIIDHVGTYAVDWVGVPLKFGDAVFGIMALQSYDPEHVYRQREVEILSFVSSHIAEVLERKSAEDALQQAYIKLEEKTQKAQAASEAKSRFLATVSHEIRTPMNGILGMLSLLSDTKISRRQKDYITKLTNSADALLHIINDILDFSKVEEGKLKLEQVSFSLIEILDNLLDLFSSKIAEKRLDFHIDLPENVNERRFGDPLRLSQILINLVGNAIKFTEQGYIYIKIRENRKNHLTCIVEDSGIGIPTDKQTTIFESFTQADNTTTRQFGGSGLGLSICQQLVHLMDGTIKVEQNPTGSGSIFSFEVHVPAIDAQHPKHGSVGKPVPVNLILITDDQKQVKAWEKFCLREKMGLLNLPLKEGLSESIVLRIEQYLGRASKSPLMIFVNYQSTSSLDHSSFEQFTKKMPDSASYYIMSSNEHYKALTSYVSPTTRLLRKPLKMSTLIELVNKANLLAQKNQELIQVTEAKARRLNGISILLAEDNRVNQMVARGMLEKEGAEVYIVDNGKSAVEKVSETEFDLVLMDMQMPIMDGYLASQTIRKTKSSKELPIIAMTANVMKGDKEKCLQHGMNDYIGKPIDREKLVKIILYYANAKPVINEFEAASTIEFDLNTLRKHFHNDQVFESALALIHEQHVNDSREICNLIAAKDFLDAATLVTNLNHSLAVFQFEKLQTLSHSMLDSLCNNQCPSSAVYQDYQQFIEGFFDTLGLHLI